MAAGKGRAPAEGGTDCALQGTLLRACGSAFSMINSVNFTYEVLAPRYLGVYLLPTSHFNRLAWNRSIGLFSLLLSSSAAHISLARAVAGLKVCDT